MEEELDLPQSEEELDADLNSSQDPPPDRPLSEQEQVIGRSPIEDFVSEFEQNVSGDPFRLVQKYARDGADVIADASVNSAGLQAASPQASGLFAHLADRLVQSAPLINQRDERKRNLGPTGLTLEQELDGFTPKTAGQLMRDRSPLALSSGFIPRAGVSEYRALISQPGEFRGVFFQAQQESIVSALAERRDSWSLVTQRLSYAPSAQGADLTELDKARLRKERQTTGQILAGNELTYEVGQLLARQRGQETAPVLGVRAYSSFHPKIGYVGDEQQGFSAFLGTQNITPALAGNNSLETLMVFNRPSLDALPGGSNTEMGIESQIASEIYQLTNTITSLASSQSFTYTPGAVRSALAREGVNRGFLYVENEIFSRIAGALSTAANDASAVANRDQVVISMGEISLLLKTRGYASNLLQSLEKLALEKRLVVVTDAHRMQQFFDTVRQTGPVGVNDQFLHLLMDTGSLRTATTGYQHDKTVAIFSGSDRQLQFLNVGSANFSADSMLPVGQLGHTGEYYERAANVMNRVNAGQFDASAPMNLDANLVIGSGRYLDPNRTAQSQSNTGIQQYLANLNRESKLLTHYDRLAGGQLMANLDGKTLTYQTGYIGERSADPAQVENLRQKLESLNQQLGGNVLEIEGRYTLTSDRRTMATETGLKVRIKGIDGLGSSTVINFTVDRYGNVVVLDTNKVVTGSVFLNKSAQPRSLNGHVLAAGASAQLSGVDTAVGLVATVAREISYQSRHGVVNDLFARLVSQNLPHAQSISRQLLANSIANVVPEIALAVEPNQGPANLTTLMGGLREHAGSLGVEVDQVLLQARRLLATGVFSANPGFTRSLTAEQLELRNQLLTPAFSELLEPHSIAQQTSERFAGLRMLGEVLLNDTEGLFNDLKLSLILSSEEGRRQYAEIQATQTRRLVGDLTAPFLAAHELGYSGLQVRARLPIYSESTLYEGEDPYNRLLRAAILNPAEVKPGTRVGEPGQYFRPVGAIAHAKPLQVPGYGGIRQVSTIDSDLSSGATVAYDFDLLLRSTLGLNKVTRESYTEQLDAIRRALGYQNPVKLSDDLDQEFSHGSVYFVPFAKAEQIPQRLKNVVGGRPTLDVNADFARRVRSLSAPMTRFDAGSVTSGRLREVLPAVQFEEVQRVHAELGGDFNRVQDYFRQREVVPTETMRGIIGPRAMKRVALIGGVSLIGDSSYLNAGYDQAIGNVHRMTVKLSSRQIKNQLEAQAVLAKYLSKGTVVFGAPIPLEDQEAGLQVLRQVEDSLRLQNEPVHEVSLQGYD